MGPKQSELDSSLWSLCDELRRGMDVEIAAIETRLARARLLKQGMMQELVTGRIRLA